MKIMTYTESRALRGGPRQVVNDRENRHHPTGPRASSSWRSSTVQYHGIHTTSCGPAAATCANRSHVTAGEGASSMFSLTSTRTDHAHRGTGSLERLCLVAVQDRGYSSASMPIKDIQRSRNGQRLGLSATSSRFTGSRGSTHGTAHNLSDPATTANPLDHLSAASTTAVNIHETQTGSTRRQVTTP